VLAGILIASLTTLALLDTDGLKTVLSQQAAAGSVFTATSTQPQIVGTIMSPQIGLHSEGLAVAGRYAYITNNNGDGVVVVDVFDPTRPVIIGSVIDHTLLNWAEDIYTAGQYAYVTTEAAGANRFTVVNIANPTNPVIVGSVKDDARLIAGEDVFVLGTYAYVSADDGNTFNVIDISNPASPAIVGSITDATRLGSAEGVWVIGRYAYVATEDSDSLVVIDVANPAAPTIVGSVVDHTLLDGASGIYVSGRYAYVSGAFASSMVVIDVGNPTNPVIIGSVVSPSLLTHTDNLTGSGMYIYATAAVSNSVVVFDVSTPANPAIVATLQSAQLNSPIGVQVAGRYAYVLGSAWDSGSPGFSVVDLAGSASPLFPTCTLGYSPSTIVKNSGSTLGITWNSQNAASRTYKGYDSAGKVFYSSPQIAVNGTLQDTSFNNLAPGTYTRIDTVVSASGATATCSATLNVLGSAVSAANINFANALSAFEPLFKALFGN
jgi:hypothetical protein